MREFMSEYWIIVLACFAVWYILGLSTMASILGYQISAQPDFAQQNYTNRYLWFYVGALLGAVLFLLHSLNDDWGWGLAFPGKNCWKRAEKRRLEFERGQNPFFNLPPGTKIPA
ncbi:MAG: hypothetical protein Q7R71_01420 [bacterium]|nr:hypothetical protein [bacterium]